jgi:Kdo2-lipid IVA lauroyltransferase/acyltransferase
VQTLSFYLFLPLLYGLSILPLRILYVISDGLYIIIYYLVGYRKNVVRQNLANSFPEKSEQERLEIERKFFSYFCDVLVETVKLLTISKEETMKRCFMKDNSVFEQAAAQGKSVVLVLGHYGNWELAALGMSLAWRYPITIIYQELSNPKFEKLIQATRSKFGAILVTKSKVYRQVIEYKGITAYTFVADQTPLPKVAYWTDFLHQDTPVFQGPEKIARKLKAPVVYAIMKPVRRGYYEMFAELMEAQPEATTEGSITEQFTRRLEADIKERPEFWLWTHRRWKQKRLPEQQVQAPI